MKKLITLLNILFISIASISQASNGFSYQAVIRNSDGELVKNQTIGVQFTILQSSPSGLQVYAEVQTPTTNINGLVTTEIGKIDSSAFLSIDWAEGPYFLKVETDLDGGNNYTISGTSQLLSVPYALYASKASNGLDYSGSPQSGDILYSNGTNWSVLSKGSNGQTLRLDNGLPSWGEPGYALPIVTTLEPTDVMVNAATAGGYIISTGFSNIIEKGVCWGTTQNPTITDNKTNNADGIGAYTSFLEELLPGTTYFIRAYATNEAGTAYGNQVSFTTFQNVVFPTITTSVATNITANAVTSGGNITETGGGEIISRGVCWSDHQNPTVSDNKTEDGNGSGQFQSQLTGLLPGVYYARAYATNSAGTGYGNMVTFETEKTLPVLTTKNVTDISAMGAVSGGAISSTGGGTISGRGICWSEMPNPTIINEKTSSTATSGSFSAAIAKAAPNTTYYLKAYATNEIGTGYGDEKTFTTSDAAYYTSFETGMTPVDWTGPFTVTNENAFDGSYSFKSLLGVTSTTTFTVTLSSSGQISFYYSVSGTFSPSLDFYIDDVKIANFPSGGAGWRQALANISAGEHTIKWQFNSNWSDNKCYLDQLTITK